ncbi:hypothetical protein QDA09_gp40 [Microbacterium phage Tyrumbra]|uniref:Uncharacterized protein n=1 Tax=Microbacterium phage Tyrumbra TaxID=2596974 RepID=A0A516KPG0_9CAUD|nr:hypothetical protein QDA09_gp40 [Microbacterium phage Tyrumbra]QDP43577.1 hypothetical protein SEA_TYRUMBRA_40 [Microbacterium phage Tyrumbra]
MTGVGEWNEVQIRDSFGRVVGVEGSFTVDVPLEVAVNGGTIEAPDGSIITVTPDPEDGLHVTAEEAQP